MLRPLCRPIPKRVGRGTRLIRHREVGPNERRPHQRGPDSIFLPINNLVTVFCQNKLSQRRLPRIMCGALSRAA